MVGDGDRWLLVGRGGRYHVFDPRRSVEHRVFGVNVEVGE
jgi:hypothetical protein